MKIVKEMYCNAPNILYCKQAINRNYRCDDCKHAKPTVPLIDRIGLSKFYKIIKNYINMLEINGKD